MIDLGISAAAHTEPAPAPSGGTWSDADFLDIAGDYSTWTKYDFTEPPLGTGGQWTGYRDWVAQFSRRNDACTTENQFVQVDALDMTSSITLSTHMPDAAEEVKEIGLCVHYRPDDTEIYWYLDTAFKGHAVASVTPTSGSITARLEVTDSVWSLYFDGVLAQTRTLTGYTEWTTIRDNRHQGFGDHTSGSITGDINTIDNASGGNLT